MTPELRRSLGAKRSEVRHIIAHEMRLKGYTTTELGRELSLTGQTVGRVINGQLHSARVLDALIKLGISQDLLFDPRHPKYQVKAS